MFEPRQPLESREDINDAEQQLEDATFYSNIVGY
jgi:hypothetical protein